MNTTEIIAKLRAQASELTAMAERYANEVKRPIGGE